MPKYIVDSYVNRIGLALFIAILCSGIAYLAVDTAVDLAALPGFLLGLVGVIVFFAGVSLAIMVTTPVSGVDNDDDDDTDIHGGFPDDIDDLPNNDDDDPLGGNKPPKYTPDPLSDMVLEKKKHCEKELCECDC